MAKSFVVFGMGRLGSTVARRLYDMHNDVLAIDTNPERVRSVSEGVTTAIQADVTDEDVLSDLGLNNFDCAIIAIGNSLESAIMATISCVEAKVPLIVAKAPTRRYGSILEKLGADRIIYPEVDMGERLAKELSKSGISGYFELSDDYGLVEYDVLDEWVGQSVSNLKFRQRYKVNVIAIRREGRMIVRNFSEEILRKGDLLIFFGSDRDLARIEEE
ncbi:MAG: TrkA family potassium uptake protein [Peptoniphilus sp.]|nr:TrkA family potassium uptake protein [Peptoniphilus sp.]MDD7363840.1 TrkA family potassium uptake protein [Bacillota bacterium]MDY6044321.1 TrkA family potassium uptake protein [Peptoniphilus sp.]